MNRDFEQFIPLLKNFLQDLQKIERKGCDEYSIAELESLIHYVYGFAERKQVDFLVSNLRQTIEKQLYLLNSNKAILRKRIDNWNDTIKHFRQDLTDAIAMIEPLQ